MKSLQNLTNPDSKGESALMGYIKENNLDLIDQKLIEFGILREPIKALQTTYLHYAASLGALKKLKPQLYTKDLTLLDQNIETAAHWAAQSDKLLELPDTKELDMSMEFKNGYAQTPLHKARVVDLIPKKYLTKASISKPDWKGDTPLFHWAWCGGANNLPLNLLDETMLVLQNKRGESALGAIISDYSHATESKSMEQVLSKLSMKTVIAIYKQDVDKGLKNLIAKKIIRFSSKIKLKEKEIEDL